MLHLIVYDIGNGRRLRRVASLCEDHGIRIQKSVFECDLDDRTFANFWNRLAAMVKDDEDTVFDYPIGLIDDRRVSVLGRIARPRRDAYVF